MAYLNALQAIERIESLAEKSGVSFVVPGVAVAKGRARAGRTRDGKPIHYTPKKTASYENLVRCAAHEAMRGQPPLSGPLRVKIEFWVLCPSSWSEKRKKEAYRGDIAPTKKPDLSNLVKAIEDACNRIVWRDDSQIVTMKIMKHYSATAETLVSVAETPARRAP